MAGFWHLSHHQMRDMNGRTYANARAYFFSAETSLPITVYQEYSLATPHPNPVQANAYGIFPPVFLDEEDGFYRQRLTSAGGVLIPGTDVGTIPIIGPGEGGGGSEVPVDENALFKTGDPLWVPVSGTRAGFVRMNGRTIGSATSGASERANADCEQLFLYNWQNYSNSFCAVSGGRGVSAAADWAANKTIAILDMRKRSPFGLDDMGNSAASGFTGITFDLGDATTAASTTGEARHLLQTTEIPTHDHDVTPTLNDSGHYHGALGGVAANAALKALRDTPQMDAIAGWFNGDSGGQGYVNFPASHETSNPLIEIKTTGITANTVTSESAGGGLAHNNMPPAMLGTWYQKI